MLERKMIRMAIEWSNWWIEFQKEEKWAFMIASFQNSEQKLTKFVYFVSIIFGFSLYRVASSCILLFTGCVHSHSLPWVCRSPSMAGQGLRFAGHNNLCLSVGSYSVTQQHKGTVGSGELCRFPGKMGSMYMKCCNWVHIHRFLQAV